MINNRQAGRRRGRNNNGGGGNGGGGSGPRQGGQGRGDNGNRIDSRSRGNASQLLEKYKNLASDAQRQGDRVNTEYYLQFADHYFRVLADQRGRFEDQQPRRQQQDFDNDGDEDYGDEGEPIRAGEQDARGDSQDRDGRQDRGDRQDREGRQDRPDRQDRADRQERGERQDRPDREDRGDRQDRPDRSDRQDARPEQRDVRPTRQEERADRPRRWDRDDRPRAMEGESGGEEVAGQRRSDPPVAGEDLDARAEAVLEADAPLGDPAPRRRGRSRRDAPTASAASVPAVSDGVDVDRLPPALGIAAANDADVGDDETPKPRRRRLRAAAPDA